MPLCLGGARQQAIGSYGDRAAGSLANRGAGDEDLVRVHRVWQDPERHRELRRQAGAVPELQGRCVDSAGTRHERNRKANGPRRTRTATIFCGSGHTGGIGAATRPVGREPAAEGCAGRGGHSGGASVGRAVATRRRLHRPGCAPPPCGNSSLGPPTGPRPAASRDAPPIVPWRSARLAPDAPLLVVWRSVYSLGDFAVGERWRGDR